METIYALSTGGARAGLAVIRLSGPASGPALDALCGVPDTAADPAAGAIPVPGIDAKKTSGLPRPSARRASLRRLCDPESGLHLDQALVLWLPGPETYTGEDMAELHVHGGRAVIAAMLDCLGRMAALRPAEAGEFTRRAFLSGRLDLSAAEGVADLIAAETEIQRRQALAQAEGGLESVIAGWSAVLLRLLAHCEAAIDFPEETGDGPDHGADDVRTGLAGLIREIDRHLADGGRAATVRDGFRIALAGAPNVGKSSLLNRLAGREAAIVSSRAGTTRDVIETRLDLAGYPVILADTAGLRDDADDPLEAEGVARARTTVAAANLVLEIRDARHPETPALAASGATESAALRLILYNKADLGLAPAARQSIAAASPPAADPSHPAQPAQSTELTAAMAISAHTGAGIDALLDRLCRIVQSCAGSGEHPAFTRARHRDALQSCRRALVRAMAVEQEEDETQEHQPELRAEDLRLALRELGRITGAVDVEDLLDVIFRDFCIGK